LARPNGFAGELYVRKSITNNRIMETAIIASIIGAITTIAAIFISPWWVRRLDKERIAKALPHSSDEKKTALIGHWNGYIDQKVGKPQVIGIHPMSMNLSNKSGIIEGTMTQDIKSAGLLQGKIINVLYDGRVLKMDYLNKDSTVVHFGTLCLKLSSDGKRLEGEFLGYGLISEMMVSGTAHFDKQATSQ
jgi:hypothetical protein